MGHRALVKTTLLAILHRMHRIRLGVPKLLVTPRGSPSVVGRRESLEARWASSRGVGQASSQAVRGSFGASTVQERANAGVLAVLAIRHDGVPG